MTPTSYTIVCKATHDTPWSLVIGGAALVTGLFLGGLLIFFYLLRKFKLGGDA